MVKKYASTYNNNNNGCRVYAKYHYKILFKNFRNWKH